MGDHHHRAVRRTQRVHTVGHDAQRIDVEAGNRVSSSTQSFGSRRPSSAGSRRLLLAAGKADIERALEHAMSMPSESAADRTVCDEFGDLQLDLAARLRSGIS